jgi:superfamily II DNA or RNA helicase
MNLVIGNSHSKLYGAPQALTKKIGSITSYRVNGHQFAPSFRAGYWDGRVKLLRRTSDKALRFPTGLLGDVLKVIENSGEPAPDVADRRRPLGIGKELPWLADDIQLRDYQHEAVEIATREGGPMAGRGILKLPIRSGKTVIAAALIHRRGLRTLFVATSQLILNQTRILFTRIFGEGIGMIGEGEFNPAFITVASIQRLQRMDAPVKALLKLIDVLLIDEVHHMEGDSWREPIMSADARYKIGLSATVSVNRKLCERSAVWLKSAAGPILMDVPMQRLVDGGYIMSPDIYMIELPNGNGSHEKASWAGAYDELIVQNGERNRTIVEATGLLVEAGHRVLVDTGRLEHIKRLYAETRRAGLDASIIYGDVSPNERAGILDDFKAGRKPVLIGTVMGEGVDVPVLSAVVNAEGGKSPSATIQRMRNLTQYPGKQNAILVDFFDAGNRYLRSHSKARVKQYQNEPAFRLHGPMVSSDFIRALKPSPGK